MHKTAIKFALKYKFRLGLDRLGYCLHNAAAVVVARPATDEYTALGAIRMMRRALRHPRAFGARATSNAFVVRGLGGGAA